jgi:hypothetical protein
MLGGMGNQASGVPTQTFGYASQFAQQPAGGANSNFQMSYGGGLPPGLNQTMPAPMPGGGGLPPGLNQTMPAPMPGGGGLPPGLNQTMPAPMPGGSQPSSTPAQPAAPATGQPDVYQTSANMYNQAAAGPNINQFMSPYTNMVTGQAMQDLNRQRQMAINDTGAAATRAGAFGGSRHGVAEALTNTGYAQQGANMFGNLQQQGFNTALNAAQNQQNIQSNLANQGFNMGQTIGNQQWQQGQFQQGLNQQLINDIRNQYGGFTGSPAAGLGIYQGGLGAANMGQQTQTQTSNPGLFDYFAAAASAFCWVAREVYGPEDDRWMQFRAWMFGAAPDWFFNAYAKHGEAFAGVVRKVPALKRVLRPLMDRARRSAGFEV